MSNLSPELLPLIQNNRLPGLDLGPGFSYPDYSGQSILNLPSTITDLLGVAAFGKHTLRSESTSQLGGRYQRICLLLVDALSLHRFQNWLQEPDFAIWNELMGSGLLAPMTSVVPSTT